MSKEKIKAGDYLGGGDFGSLKASWSFSAEATLGKENR